MYGLTFESCRSWGNTRDHLRDDILGKRMCVCVCVRTDIICWGQGSINGGRGSSTVLKYSAVYMANEQNIKLDSAQRMYLILIFLYRFISQSLTSTILKLTSPGTNQSFPSLAASLSLILTTTGGRQLAMAPRKATTMSQHLKRLSLWRNRILTDTHTHQHTTLKTSENVTFEKQRRDSYN